VNAATELWKTTKTGESSNQFLVGMYRGYFAQPWIEHHKRFWWYFLKTSVRIPRRLLCYRPYPIQNFKPDSTTNANKNSLPALHTSHVCIMLH